jgi:hypothetical protein
MSQQRCTAWRRVSKKSPFPTTERRLLDRFNYFAERQVTARA